MIEFKRQSKRATKMDSTQNINIFLKGLEFGVVSSQNWGSSENRIEPLITIELEGKFYEFSLTEFKEKLKKVVNSIS